LVFQGTPKKGNLRKTVAQSIQGEGGEVAPSSVKEKRLSHSEKNGDKISNVGGNIYINRISTVVWRKACIRVSGGGPGSEKTLWKKSLQKRVNIIGIAKICSWGRKSDRSEKGNCEKDKVRNWHPL